MKVLVTLAATGQGRKLTIPCIAPTDIFPEIRIAVIAVVWQYAGLPPDEMAGRIPAITSDD